MPIHLTSVVVASAMLAIQAATPPPAPTPSAGTAKPAAQSAGAKPGSLALTVVSEKGDGLLGAGVVVHGLVERAGSTGADGVLVLLNMPPGTYRCRIVRDGFITLEKEVVVGAGVRTATEGVLSAAPPPPPPPPPPPAPVETRPSAPAGPVGAPKVVSIAEMADQILRDMKDPVVERQLGCSVATSSRLIVARENIAIHRHADADEVLYLVAGEATFNVGDKDQQVVAGWFGLVPRGTSHAITRRGRNPIVVLSVQSGVACSGAQVLGSSGSPVR